MSNGYNRTLRYTRRALAGLACSAESCSGRRRKRLSGASSVTNLWALNLAGPAGGPVESVWFSPSGDRLYARTDRAKSFETSNFADWTSVDCSYPHLRQMPGCGRRDGRVYSLGQDLEVSDDNGRSFVNLHGVSWSVHHRHRTSARWRFRRSIRVRSWWPMTSACGDPPIRECPGPA